jgi:thiol-disulfide isomerase/thioredoxin
MKQVLVLLTFLLGFSVRAEILRAGDSIPNFYATTLEGKSIEYKSVAGKNVFLFFWATDCSDCLDEIAALNILNTSFKDKGLRVIGVNVIDPPNVIKNVVQQKNIDFEIWYTNPVRGDTDLTKKLEEWQGFGAGFELPWAFITGQDGMIKRHVQLFDETSIDRLAKSIFSPDPIARGIKPGADMKDFTLRTNDGRVVTWNKYQGKPVIINFWGSWCPPCRAEMPILNVLYGKYKEKGLIVLGINYQETPEVAQKYLSENPVDYTVLYGLNDPVLETRTLFNTWGGNGVPWSLFIGKDGKVASWIFGYSSNALADVERRINQIL